MWILLFRVHMHGKKTRVKILSFASNADMNFWLISIYANEFLIAGVMTLAWELFQSAMFSVSACFTGCIPPFICKNKSGSFPLISSRQESCWSFMSHLEQVGDFFFFSLSLQAAFIWASTKALCVFLPRCSTALLHRNRQKDAEDAGGESQTQRGECVCGGVQQSKPVAAVMQATTKKMGMQNGSTLTHDRKSWSRSAGFECVRANRRKSSGKDFFRIKDEKQKILNVSFCLSSPLVFLWTTTPLLPA